MLDVIGVGFGRTGTLSLKRALKQLGYSPCYHFTELFKIGHLKYWLAVSHGRSPDWQYIMRGYRATTDWPVAAFPESLFKAYPNARFILSTRDPEAWYDSVHASIYPLRQVLPRWLPGFRAIRRISDYIIWHGTFDDQFENRKYAIARLTDHENHIKTLIPPDQLLVFDVREGWEPLCRILNAPIPIGVPFPRSNERTVIKRYIKILKALPIATGVLIALLLMGVLL